MKCGDVHPHPGPQAPRPSQVTGDHFQQFQRKVMHMMHLNARSLVNKIPESKNIAQKARAAVIEISERLFEDTITDAETAISGYSVLRHDRNHEGGGVFAYIRNDIAFNPTQELQNNYTEIIWFDLLLLPKSKPIVVCVC